MNWIRKRVKRTAFNELPDPNYFDTSHLTVHEGQPRFSALLADEWAQRY